MSERESASVRTRERTVSLRSIASERSDTVNGVSEPGAHDLRMVLLGAVAWAAALVALLLGWWWLVASSAVAALGVRRWRGCWDPTVLAVVLVALGVGSGGALRQEQVTTGPAAKLAAREATVSVRLVVATDPRRLTGGFTEQTILRGRVVELTGRGTSYRLSAPVLVIGDEGWRDAPLGATVEASGRLAPARDGDLAAVLLARGPPELVEAPGTAWAGAARVREGIRDAVADRPPEQAGLVPALVAGDESRLPEDLADDFRATGLTHLLAVSGTNLTLIVGFLLIVARWAGVRGRWLLLVGALGIVGFILLARTEPSVVRAAAMGAVGLLALGPDGRRRGPRSLGVAVAVLLLLDPWLATTAGFALSVLATAGIVFVAPVWRDALARWLPRWIAEAVSVPTAAALACTPLVAGLSEQVSLVAIVANLLAAPAVGPATVLGLVAGLLDLVWAPLGAIVGTGAGWCVAWVIAVARYGADLPTAAVTWGAGPVWLIGLSVACLVVALVGPRVVRRRTGGVLCGLAMIAVIFVRPPSPGWPPPGWVVAACDVGQGDALLLRAGEGSAVVVDAGPEPADVARCLRDFEVDAVPLLVLTHFHADHVGGLAGVLDDWPVAEVLAGEPTEPSATVSATQGTLAEYDVRSRPPRAGEVLQVGEVTLQTLWPPADRTTPTGRSAENNASIVLIADVAGARILLTGDIETEAQTAIERAWPDLGVDVLKVPHHGSRYQDRDFLLGLGARVAVISAGADNDYGHPAPELLGVLGAAGTTVLRTDTDGDVAVVAADGDLAVARRE